MLYRGADFLPGAGRAHTDSLAHAAHPAAQGTPGAHRTPMAHVTGEARAATSGADTRTFIRMPDPATVASPVPRYVMGAMDRCVL